MIPLQFGDPERLLLGFHHPATGAARRTAVLICPSWGREYLRSYRGVRLMAMRLAEAGFETLRFDYSGTGDSAGHSLDAHLEHWLADIATAAEELRLLSGHQDIAVLGVRFGALLAEAARHRLGLRVKFCIHWDAPESGASYATLMQRLADESDISKRLRRNRDMQLPPPDPHELFGHAWPVPLAEAVNTLSLPSLEVPSLWYVSTDHAAPAKAPPETVLSSQEAGHWHELGWINAPWVPAAPALRLAEHLGRVLP